MTCWRPILWYCNKYINSANAKLNNKANGIVNNITNKLVGSNLFNANILFFENIFAYIFIFALDNNICWCYYSIQSIRCWERFWILYCLLWSTSYYNFAALKVSGNVFSSQSPNFNTRWRHFFEFRDWCRGNYPHFALGSNRLDTRVRFGCSATSRNI